VSVAMCYIAYPIPLSFLNISLPDIYRDKFVRNPPCILSLGVDEKQNLT